MSVLEWMDGRGFGSRDGPRVERDSKPSIFILFLISLSETSLPNTQTGPTKPTYQEEGEKGCFNFRVYQ